MKIYMAGTSTRGDTIAKLDFHIPYVLESFYYFQPWQKDYIQNCKGFLLDSGAFTFMNGAGSVNFENYASKYAKFIKENKIQNYFELDVDVVVGYEKVIKFREFIENETGIKSIPVWHKSRGLDEWQKLTENYSYVAIGGIVTREIPKKKHYVFKDLISIANKNNCMVHGLGYTPLENKYKFYSCDSTSWLGGSLNSIVYYFKDGRLEKYTNKKKKRVHYKILDKQNLSSWYKYQLVMEGK